MKRFIIQILVFSIVFFAIEKIFYAFILVSPNLEYDRRLEQVINSNLNKDLIIFGSSRGARNILASKIENTLDLSSFNLSYPGSNIEFHEFLLKSLLKFNKKPKIVLLAVDAPMELLPSKSIVFRSDRLYPLSKYNYINNTLIERGEKNFLSHFFALARVNKKNFDVRRKKISSLDTIKYLGSMPISFQRKNREFNYTSNTINYNKEKELDVKVKAFQNFQKMCITNDIQLFLVYPPNFESYNIQFENRINELSLPEVTFIHYDTTNIIYKDRNYFYDENHLKMDGAKIFTNEVINQLKSKIVLKKDS